MNNFEIKETLRQANYSIQFHQRMLNLFNEVHRGDMTMELFAVRAFDETSHSVHVNSLDMLASRARDLLDTVELEGLRIASLKPEPREGFMKPFWVDGHWKFTPKLGHDEEGRPI